MRNMLAAITIVLSACTTVNTTQSPTPPDSVQSLTQIDHTQYDTRYNELVGTVKQAASVEDFEELREVYVFTSHYNPYFGPERTLSEAMFDAMAKEDWAACLSSSNKILDGNYISLNAHYGAMVCSFESSDKDAGDYHQYVLEGLLDAIWSTGDGKSTETAFFCTSTPELQAFIQLHGLQTESQALVHAEGKSFDMMDVKDPDSGKAFTWYFDISAQWALGFNDLK